MIFEIPDVGVSQMAYEHRCPLLILDDYHTTPIDACQGIIEEPGAAGCGTGASTS